MKFHYVLCVGVLALGNISLHAGLSKKLRQAAADGDRVMVEQLLEQGVDVNVQDKEGRAPLHEAAHNGNFEMVELLVKYHAQIDVVTQMQWLPLHLAADQGHTFIVGYLLNQNPGMLNRVTDFGTTMLYAAANEGHKDIVALLLERKARIDVCDHWKRSALHGAALGKHQEIFDMLVAAGGDPGQKDVWGQSARDYLEKPYFQRIINDGS